MAFDPGHAGIIFLVGIILYSLRSSSLEMRNFLSFLEEIRKKCKIGAKTSLLPDLACLKKNHTFRFRFNCRNAIGVMPVSCRKIR